MNLEKWIERKNTIKEYLETNDFSLSDDADDIKRVILHLIDRECPLDADIELFRKKIWTSIMVLLRDTDYGCGCSKTPSAIQKLLDDMIPHWVDFYNNTPLIATFYRRGRKEIKTYHLHDTAGDYAKYQRSMMRARLINMYKEGRIDITDDIITIVNKVNEDE